MITNIELATLPAAPDNFTVRKVGAAINDRALIGKRIASIQHGQLHKC